MRPTITDIRAAIEAEREIAAAPISARVRRIDRTSQGLAAHVDPLADAFNRPFDEALEGARSWWPGEPPGKADVFAVDPDRPSVLLRRVLGPVPQANQIMQLYEHDYYGPLATLWSTERLSERALESLSYPGGDITPPAGALDLKPLREAQRTALGLTRYPVSLLWGPPGTGKTTTIAMLAADELASGRSGRIVLTAPTHIAVDQAVRALDDVLERAGLGDLRGRVKRIGSGVDPKLFAGREHLLPVADLPALAQLSALLEEEPPRSDLQAWSGWKQDIDIQRGKLRAPVAQLLRDNACIALTLTSAFFWFDALLTAGIDLVVIDEASQVGGPAARMIATTARRALFAGDPRQLAPVVRTKAPDHRKVLSQTAFDIAGEAPRVFLNEQSRMAPPICRIVSKVFYDNRLIVAHRERLSKTWLREHSPFYIGGRQHSQIDIHRIDDESTWSSVYKGPIRHASAVAALELVDALMGSGVGSEDILVLTPFRAQRMLLRRMLAARRVNGIDVRTVHRAQGGERAVVLFDPVNGASAFLEGRQGERLINVAISRAQSQVSLFLSAGDLRHPVLRYIAQLAQSARNVQVEQPTTTGQVPQR